jgi:hypothetical protein
MTDHLSTREGETDSVLRPASLTTCRPSPRQPQDGRAILVAGTLIFSIAFLGIACLDMWSDGGVLPLLNTAFWAFVRWPALFLLPIVIGAVVYAGRRDRR